MKVSKISADLSADLSADASADALAIINISTLYKKILHIKFICVM